MRGERRAVAVALTVGTESESRLLASRNSTRAPLRSVGDWKPGMGERVGRGGKRGTGEEGGKAVKSACSWGSKPRDPKPRARSQRERAAAHVQGVGVAVSYRWWRRLWRRWARRWRSGGSSPPKRRRGGGRRRPALKKWSAARRRTTTQGVRAPSRPSTCRGSTGGSQTLQGPRERGAKRVDG